ncbi:hypothetical protein RIF29_11709 [Crotalaria pallida]|uniref:Uncharacterized protein n=1 Tax=Crotalaria pallida TaxID=3830 RepID=A0AAN9IMD8_CROPI
MMLLSSVCLGVTCGVEVFQVENGGSGFEGIAVDSHRGHAASDNGVFFEDEDFGGGSVVRVVFTEEVCNGGASDADTNDADGGGGNIGGW